MNKNKAVVVIVFISVVAGCIFCLCSRTSNVNIYFSNSSFDPEVSCEKVFPVVRTVSGHGLARTAIEKLLEGPNESEKKEGYRTSINQGVKIQKLTIEEGIATIDFNSQLGYQVGGSCRVSFIRKQIEDTLMQFPSIDKVVISIDGRTEDILQP